MTPTWRVARTRMTTGLITASWSDLQFQEYAASAPRFYYNPQGTIYQRGYAELFQTGKAAQKARQLIFPCLTTLDQ